ncbi:MAG: type I-C CRISPR-associated protein Cas7/Csd2 [Solobacterium sp.]|nr:type I-C CRISPR-associated protein Cas7/Csd2 [Solobacterium sp.]
MPDISEKKPINNRYEFTILFDVENGNPNGDPDADNMPRVDVDTNIGLVTDVCIKRKIRNYVQMNYDSKDGYDIYINRLGTLNSKDEKALTALETDKINKNDKEAFVINYMCSHYFDIRTFGAVMTTFTQNDKKIPGNAGQLTGPVQLTFAKSINEVYPQNITITRVAITAEKDANKKTEMGNKWIIPYGLYRMDGYISANLAQKTGFNDADLEVLWTSIMNMFEEDHSAARGNMVVRKLIIFKHESKNGNAPSHKLFEKIVIHKKETVESPRSFNDYIVSVPSNEELPEGVSVEVRD